MLELLALIYLSRKIGDKAYGKGLKPGQWKLFMVLAWILFEFLGAVIGVLLFGKLNVAGILIFALACGFGGYLLINYILDQRPDSFDESDIDNIGNN